ncbi:MAG TPA: threonine synthase [Chloroflexota bacterium]|nr:threonine synthase [Chloroflexota bacterium]
MSKVLGLKCKECGEVYATGGIHVCELCFGPLEVALDYDYIKSVISREKIENGPISLWRYVDLLPVESGWDPDVRVGFTPLQHAPRLGAAIGLKNLYVKNDSVNPTYSFKDRPVAIAVTKARELGYTVFACASTGNLASAVAAAGVKAEMETYVFLPSDVEAGKITNAAVYGANLIAVNGTYDQLNRLCSEIADEEEWAFCNINVRPYYAEGSKTLAFETVEQLEWQAPDHVVVPIASGALYTKIAQGFEEMVMVGLIDSQSVRVSGAQAKGCGPVAAAFATGEDAFEPVRQPDTVAKSLAIGNPADGNYSLEVARRTGGVIESVTDAETVEGIKLLAGTEGIFTEAAGGVTIATLKKLAASGVIGEDEVTVAYVTGNGLKTQEAVDGHVSVTMTIQPTIGSFEDALEDQQEAVLAQAAR